MRTGIRRAGHTLAALLLSVSLSACLPESDVADDFGSAGGSNFSAVEGRAATMAGTASQLAFDIQSAVINSTAWTDASNAVTEGAFANLTAPQQTALGLDGVAGLNNGTLAAGYCDLDADPDVENNALVTWFQNPGGGTFTVKGLGTQATSQITQSLTTRLSPNMVGISDGTSVSLAGPRSGGGSTVDLAACGLGIPSGVPVVFLENIRRDLSLNDKTILVYETVTSACGNGQVGGLSESVEYRLNVSENTRAETGNRTVISNTCSDSIANIGSNAFSQQQVASISSALLSTAGAGGASTGGLGGILSDLDNMDCAEMDRNLLSDEDTSDPTANTDSRISTCDTGAGAGTVTLVEAVDAEMNGSDITMDTLNVSCAGANLPSASTFVGRYSGVNGTVTLLESWNGSGVDMARSAGRGEMDGTSNALMQRAAWAAQSVDCTRREELTISCSAAFPAYNSGYTLISGGGVKFRRTNSIDGWENAATYTIDKGMDNDEGWSFHSINCAWRQDQSFNNCPSGFTPSVTGAMRRNITATGWGSVSPAAWTSVTASQCTRTTTSGSACVAPPPTNNGDDAP